MLSNACEQDHDSCPCERLPCSLPWKESYCMFQNRFLDKCSLLDPECRANNKSFKLLYKEKNMRLELPVILTHVLGIVVDLAAVFKYINSMHWLYVHFFNAQLFHVWCNGLRVKNEFMESIHQKLIVNFLLSLKNFTKLRNSNFSWHLMQLVKINLKPAEQSNSLELLYAPAIVESE